MHALTETTVLDGYLVRIPDDARRRLDIEPGDHLIWEMVRDHIVIRVKKQHVRGFADLEPFDFGEETHASASRDVVVS